MKRHRSLYFAVLVLALGFAAPLPADSQGMMGGGMGGGMMGGYGAPGQSNGRSARWDRLASYISSNRLPCLSCHRFSGRAAAPAFIDIAQRFRGQPNAAVELSGAIRYGVAGRWPGYPPMPGGLATPRQAKELTALILDLGQ